MTHCRTKPTVPISFHAVHSCIHTAAAKLSCGTEHFTAYKPRIFILLPFTGNNSDDTRFSIFPFCHTCLASLLSPRFLSFQLAEGLNTIKHKPSKKKCSSIWSLDLELHHHHLLECPDYHPTLHTLHLHNYMGQFIKSISLSLSLSRCCCCCC